MADINPPAPVLILVRDLLLCSRVTTAARESNIPFKVIRDPAKLAGEVGNRLIVDLNQPGAVPAAAEWRNQTKCPVIGFVSHLDAQTIAQAKVANLERVLVRSQFVQDRKSVV